MQTIPLTDRHGEVVAYALVDDEDHEALTQHRWHLSRSGYAVRTLPRDGGTPGASYMHREILGLDQGDRRQGDHLNRVRLDNRRTNLRVVTHAANRQNVRGRPGTSQHRGVYRRPSGRWAAQVRAHGRVHVIGTYDTESEAAHAAATARRALLPFSAEGVE